MPIKTAPVPTITIPATVYYELMMAKQKYETIIKGILDKAFPNLGVSDEFIFETCQDQEEWATLCDFYRVHPEYTK